MTEVLVEKSAKARDSLDLGRWEGIERAQQHEGTSVHYRGWSCSLVHVSAVAQGRGSKVNRKRRITKVARVLKHGGSIWWNFESSRGHKNNTKIRKSLIADPLVLTKKIPAKLRVWCNSRTQGC